MSFWLIPAEPWRSRLQATIDRLGARHGTPRFEAHVTMHVGVAGETPVESVVDAVAAEFPRLQLVCGPTAHGEARFKTLFIPFDDPLLVRMHQRFRELLGTPSDYHFAPHLSLAYGPLADSVRTQLAVAEDRRGESIVFDGVAIGLPAAGTTDWSQVEEWRVVERRGLSR